jgi:hypothetical protein
MASRKVVTEFAAFGAPKNASVFGTAVQSTPFSLAGGTAAFGALRTNKPPGTMEDDDDDDDDAHDGGLDHSGPGESRSLFPFFVAVTNTVLQAKRIAMSSAWRNVRN